MTYFLKSIKPYLKKFLNYFWNLAVKISQKREKLEKFYYYYIKIKNINKLFPPLVWLAGGPDVFIKTGNEMFIFLKEIGGLKPTDKLLDLGCGIGRVVYPLLNYLTSGKYEGFDINAENINWLRENITSKYPNFHFQFGDIYNAGYNPKGKFTPSNYEFPYKNETFDFVFLISVFTHMLPKDINCYLSEISRVLKKNGRCVITYFLLNPRSLKFINEKRSKLDFKYEYEGYKTINKDKHEIAVAYGEMYIRSLYKKNGFKLLEPIYYGNWYNRKKKTPYYLIEINFQDVIVAEKLHVIS